MSEETQKQLERAYTFIQREQLDEALDILRPIVEQSPDDADAWWLMANAVAEPRQARRALVNVLRINPTHARARDLLNKLNEIYPPRDDELMMMMEIPELEEGFAASEEELDFTEDLFPDEEALAKEFDEERDPFAELLQEGRAEPAKKAAGGGRLRLLLIAAMLIVIPLLVIVLVVTGGGEADTGAADVSPITAANLDDPQLETIRQLTANEVTSSTAPGFGPNSTAIYADTGVGTTLFVQTCLCMTSTCTGPGPEKLSDLAFEGIDLAAERLINAPDNIRQQVPAVGVTFGLCGESSTDTLYRAFVNLDAVNEYHANGDKAAFRSRWTVEG